MFISLSDWREDLRACTEILNSCLKLAIPLSDVQSQKLINLLLKKSTKVDAKPKDIPSKKFEFKF